MAYTPETWDFTAAARRAANHATNAVERDLINQWIKTWQALEPEFTDAWWDIISSADGDVTAAQVAKARRLAAALDHAYGELQELAFNIGATALPQLDPLLGSVVEARWHVYGSQLPQGTSTALQQVGFDKLSKRQLKAIGKRCMEEITSRAKPLVDDAVQAMKNALITGITVGDHPEQVARDMVKKTETVFNGGLPRATTIARTEMMDAHNAADQEMDDLNAALLTGWEWEANLDVHTCPACISQHGTFHELDEPGPLDHPNGRCYRVPALKPWKDLGFKTPEPKPLGKVDKQDWWDGLSKGEQNQVMGPTRAQKIRDGDLTLDDLARVRKNKDWRDSIEPIPVSQL